MLLRRARDKKENNNTSPKYFQCISTSPKHGRLHNLLSKLFIMCPRHLVISREKNVTLTINFVFLLQKENTISYRF